MKTLIVEDDFVSRKLISHMLMPLGECDLAANGKEAIEAFNLALEDWKPYTLVCLDITMPEMNGHAVLQVMRKIEEKNNIAKANRTKVIMTTASADRENVMAAVKAECDGYLVKPIVRQKLMEKLIELGLLSGENDPAAVTG